MKFDEKAARYDEMLESEFGTQNVMLECEVLNELMTEEIGADADGGDQHYYVFAEV